jgi:hypothetical protein
VSVERYELPQWVELLGPAWELARRLERASEFVPDAFVGRAEAIMSSILAGAEIGLTPMQSLRSIHVIKGRPTLSAEAMRALILARGHEITFTELGEDKVTVVGRRKDSDVSTSVTWTIRQAQQARLTGNPSWKDFPRAMLSARASTELARLLFPDVVAGLASSEEASDGYPLEARESDTAPPTPIRRRRNPPPAAALAGASGEATGAGTAASPSQPPPLPGEPGYDDVPVDPDTGVPVDLAELPDIVDVARRKLFALARDAFPHIKQGQRELYRHALTVLATRDRESGPTIHFGELTDGERAGLTALLIDVRTGKLLVATEPGGTVVATSNHRQAVITPPPEGDDGWTVTIQDR